MVMDIRLMAAGVTPSSRPACPSDVGLLFVNFSTTSFDSPLIRV